MRCGRCHERGERRRLILAKTTNRYQATYFYFLCRGRQDGTCDLPLEHVEDAVLQHWATQHLSDDFTARVRRNLQTVLHETSTSLRLLHEQLAGELRSI